MYYYIIDVQSARVIVLLLSSHSSQTTDNKIIQQQLTVKRRSIQTQSLSISLFILFTTFLYPPFCFSCIVFIGRKQAIDTHLCLLYYDNAIKIALFFTIFTTRRAGPLGPAVKLCDAIILSFFFYDEISKDIPRIIKQNHHRQFPEASPPLPTAAAKFYSFICRHENSFAPKKATTLHGK